MAIKATAKSLKNRIKALILEFIAPKYKVTFHIVIF